MNFDDIKDELNDPSFNIDLASLLMRIHTGNLMNGYHLKAILKRQVEILESHKGKTGQELETAVESELGSLNNKFSEWLKDDLMNDVNDFSAD